MIYFIFVILGLIFIAFSIRFTWWWLPIRRGLLIFMYHHITDDIKDVPLDSTAFYIDPKVFEKQIDFLLKKGFNFISFDDLTSAYLGKTTLPKKPVMITFDDGYLDNYKNVFPILKKKNIKATIFLIAQNIGNDKTLMTWEQVLEMQKSGLVAFGSHGLTHKNIRRMPEEEAKNELIKSKKIIEEKLGKEITSFCYPFGAGGTDKRVRKLVFEAGYLFDISTRRGLNAWPWNNKHTLRRAFPRRWESKLDFILQTYLGRSKL